MSTHGAECHDVCARSPSVLVHSRLRRPGLIAMAAKSMARKTTHERYLGRPRSSQSEELTTRTCIAPARCAPRKWRCDLRSRELSGDQLDFT
eukprot:scaffold41664_cov33-Phaeocystis_antarctica.AAC.1